VKAPVETSSAYKLVVSDNGIGKSDIIATPARGGLGTTLVTSAREVGTVLLELKLAGRPRHVGGGLAVTDL
jgi:two-component sensor histidine kinase